MIEKIKELESRIDENNERIADLDLQNLMILEEIREICGE